MQQRRSFKQQFQLTHGAAHARAYRRVNAVHARQHALNMCCACARTEAHHTRIVASKPDPVAVSQRLL